jgi:hypothetical protein
MDQPTAEKALKELEVLVGEWSQTATPTSGEPWPGEAKSTFEWLEGGQLLLERSIVEMPEAPNGVCVYGCDAANGSYYQLYTDDRNVCRVYQMSIGNGEWKLWREGEPFNQRFTATISDDGDKIEGSWEYDEGDGWKNRLQSGLQQTALSAWCRGSSSSGRKPGASHPRGVTTPSSVDDSLQTKPGQR